MAHIRFPDEEQKQQIGYNFILEQLDVLTPYGMEERRSIKPFGKSEKMLLISELDNLSALTPVLSVNRVFLREIQRLLSRLRDIRSTLKRCSSLITLDDVELYEIKNFSILISEIIEVYKKLGIELNNIKFTQLTEVTSLLDPEGKKLPTFHIYESYSEKLKTVREKKRLLEQRISREAGTPGYEGLKKERVEVAALESEEELNIRSYLTGKLSALVPAMDSNIKSVARLDLLIAKALLALRYNAVRPEISDTSEIKLEDSVNPGVSEALKLKGRDFTPVSITLKSGTTILTGANMGGKSVSMKTAVLNLLLGQMGFFVFCTKACLPILDFICFVSDDMQSVSRGLSTFGAEIVKLKEITEYARGGTGFIALDEFARGTNPREGYYLVKALAKHLSVLPSISLIATHYDGIAEDGMVHYQVVGLRNVNFDSLKHKIDLNRKKSVELIGESIDYRLEEVSNESRVPKDALNIAVLLGLDDDIIHLAKDYYEMEERHGKQIES